MQNITIYTDGAARGNPGPAGWGAIIINGERVLEFGGRSDHATNNQMELTAPIEALRNLTSVLTDDLTIDIYSDSKYVILGITEWIHNWMKNDWRNAAKKPVLNKELWQELYKVSQGLNIAWHYVEGHSGDQWNERADEIATSFADEIDIELKKG